LLTAATVPASYANRCSLNLALILDPTLFAQFIAWGRNIGENGDAWQISFYDTAISVVKFRYGYQNQEVDYSTIPLIKSLRKTRNQLDSSYETNVRKDKSEKWLEPEEMIIILKHLKGCTAKYDYKGKKRSAQVILSNWQKYLLVLLMFHYPIRVREVCNMRWGINLEWKLNKETGQEGYYCKYTKEETKTEKAKEWFLDPKVFNQPLGEWLEVERPTAGVTHHFIFFMFKGVSKGSRYNENSLANLFRNTVYAACRDLRFAAQEELQILISQGKTEQEARQALSEDHQYFVDFEPHRTNIHYARHLGSTHIRKAELPHSVIKAFHNIIGNSVTMGDKVYNQMELHEETAAAISWRRDLIESGKVKDEASLNMLTDRFIGALLMILTKEQKRRLSEQGFDLMDLK
jgi:integrase